MRRFAIFAAVAMLSACSVLDKMVYRIDIPQGNYLEQRDVDQLRKGMNKEQVKYVLGQPVADNAFDNDRWMYVYQNNPNNGDIYRKELVLNFEQGRLVSMSGDFDKPAQFDTPLEQAAP